MIYRSYVLFDYSGLQVEDNNTVSYYIASYRDENDYVSQINNDVFVEQDIERVNNGVVQLSFIKIQNEIKLYKVNFYVVDISG